MKTSRFIVAVIAASLLIAQPAHADQITGSGSSFIANFINECRVQYGKVSGHNIEYTPLGSGAGINMFMQGTVDFAASDVAASQVNKAKDFVYVPLVAGPIAIAYRIDGYKGKIQLKKQTLAKIFEIQGNIPKAIYVYEQLGLIIPEKKSYFASQIRKLKKISFFIDNEDTLVSCSHFPLLHFCSVD
jgi:phosphate transport system substrate-binding protein